jgi:symplekin
MCFRSVLVVLGIAPDSQTSSQAQKGVAPDSQNSSQVQTSEAQTGLTSNSDNVVTEKSKESSGAT